jgi:hypothetical protein
LSKSVCVEILRENFQISKTKVNGYGLIVYILEWTTFFQLGACIRVTILDNINEYNKAVGLT